MSMSTNAWTHIGNPCCSICLERKVVLKGFETPELLAFPRSHPVTVPTTVFEGAMQS